MEDFVILLVVSADIVIINKSTCMQSIPPKEFLNRFHPFASNI